MNLNQVTFPSTDIVAENLGTTPIRIALVEIKSLADAPFDEIGDTD